MNAAHHAGSAAAVAGARSKQETKLSTSQLDTTRHAEYSTSKTFTQAVFVLKTISVTNVNGA